MKISIPLIILLFVNTIVFAQTSADTGIRLQTKFSSENPELRDIIQFEGIEYLKLKFTGQTLKGKSYLLTVKEIWDGQVTKESTIMNTEDLPIKQLQTIQDTTLNIGVISKLTHKNKLRMSFRFPGVGTTKEYDAIDSEDYSLRPVAETKGKEVSTVDPSKKFYLLAYILPYEKDGAKYWCAVEDSGKDIEKWGKEFRIKHYLVFEMEFK